MAALRCSPCDINYAVTPANRTCSVCQAATWKVADEVPDPKPDGSIPQHEPDLEYSPDPIHAHRVARYLDLGFTQVDSILLAGAKDRQGFFVWWGLVKRVLDQGATREQAVAIFA